MDRNGHGKVMDRNGHGVIDHYGHGKVMDRNGPIFCCRPIAEGFVWYVGSLWLLETKAKHRLL